MPTETTAIPSWVAEDLEWASTIHAMMAPALLSKDVLGRYVDFDRRSIDWETIAEDSPFWSSGEKLLIGVAFDMWRATGETALFDVVAGVDGANLSHVLQTVRIRRRMESFALAATSVLEDLAHRVEVVGQELLSLEDEIDVYAGTHDGWGTSFGDLSAFAINRLSTLAQRIRATVQ